jgi:hypothetical protein
MYVANSTLYGGLMTIEDMIVMIEESINNLEELRAYLVNQGD